MDVQANQQTAGIHLSRYQKFILFILAFLQFTVILDFMIMSPLGAFLMPALKISPSQFSAVVSAYAFSAGIAGFLSAGFADRFDRKKILLFFYIGFLIGTLFCALSPNFIALLLARIVTGLFGGVIGSVVFAIATDLFPYQVRGKVMGILQTSFAASQVLGLPAGVFFSNLFGWHAPFLVIVGVGSIAGVIIFLKVKPIDEHLKLGQKENALHHLISTLKVPRYLFAFSSTALLGVGGYMLMPFGSAFSVHNLGLQLSQLPMVYMITGMVSIVVGPLVGRLSDSIGRFKVFLFGAMLTAAMVLIYTHLGSTPLGWVILVNCLLFTGIFSRMIPAQALISAIPEPSKRGAFMAVNSSLQQISGGIASIAAGLIVSESPTGEILHLDQVGYVMIGTVLVTTWMMYLIESSIIRSPAVQN